MLTKARENKHRIIMHSVINKGQSNNLKVLYINQIFLHTILNYFHEHHLKFVR